MVKYSGFSLANAEECFQLHELLGTERAATHFLRLFLETAGEWIPILMTLTFDSQTMVLWPLETITIYNIFKPEIISIYYLRKYHAYFF